MNSKDCTGNSLERPQGTYTLNQEGKVVKSQGLKDFNGLYPTDTISLSSSLSWSSVHSLNDSSTSIKSSTDSGSGMHAADNLMSYIDGIIDKYDNPKLPKRTEMSSFSEHNLTKSGISTAGTIQGAQSNARPIQSITGIGHHPIRGSTPSGITHILEVTNVSPRRPCLQEGIMAVRLPPIINKEDLNDVFRKDVSEKVMMDIRDLLSQPDVPTSPYDVDEPKINQTAAVTQSTATNKIDVLIEEFNKEIALIDMKTIGAVVKPKKRIRKFMCGLNGENDGEDASKVEGEEKKTRNVFQRMWRRIKKMF